ncbi:glyoxalase I-like protein GILP, putative [Plasmodium chabaudi chabaudi]|uniref:Glyoxalase I-like protein GILP, putative n=1 Tax=Plasmodium chabaudi chabaudi TaxID=31271 RepID=A0A4V0JZR2_PLACU|nr:glyoxalase I-like protein GILP, putative [Plasmodium chabaudi chabaudi]VTZ66221.1 glyoxalase I-like protein GILP, putative [Plasmodium chabaudi chabaudi]|eukprot:XP_743141.2 glyoxalase I, putative [Plasmodium chabaudi chabaudi]
MKFDLMNIYFLLVFFFFFKQYDFLNISKKYTYNFLNGNIIRKKEKYSFKNLKCKVEGIEYKVQDVDNSVDFYNNVLGFQVAEKGNNYAKLILGNNEAYIKLIKNEQDNFIIGEHSFLGLGIHLKEFDLKKVHKYKGQVEEELDKRPVTACILPDEDAQVRRYWTNCFITDPDGYGIEVVLEEDVPKLNRIRLYTTSTKDSQKFYSDILGMDLVKIQSHLEEISYPWNIYGGMSYYFSNKNNSTILQLAYAYDENNLHMGNSLGNLILSFQDLNALEKKLKENDIEIVKSNGEIIVKDFDGYNICLKQIT